MALGRRVFGLGVIAMGAVALALGGAGTLPAGLPSHVALGYAAAVFLVLAGAALQWRRSAPWAAGAVAAYYGVVVLGLMSAREVAAHYREFLVYFDVAQPLDDTGHLGIGDQGDLDVGPERRQLAQCRGRAEQVAESYAQPDQRDPANVGVAQGERSRKRGRHRGHGR